MRYPFLVLLVIILVGCQSDQSADVVVVPAVPSADPAPAPVVDMHTSRHALDWPGVYEGLLHCEDCAGIHTRLTLQPDGGFEIVTRPLVRGAVPVVTAGQFDWEAGDNVIVLSTAENQPRFAVGEGRVLRLEAGQAQAAWGNSGAILTQSTPDRAGSRQSLAEVLEDHLWLLIDARDANNQGLDVLFPAADRSFSFNFAASRLHVEGGCNGMRGAFQLNADDMLELSAGMSTMMACDEALMQADATLAALLAEQLETILVSGVEPRLVLLSAGGDVLVLSGELTLEARFGAPTTIFLEVGPQLVACEGSSRSDGLCLNVREISFDEQGLLVGEASEWQPFAAEIQGYRHETGLRNVLRVNRFEPGPDMPLESIYLLDLVVQSEQVP